MIEQLQQCPIFFIGAQHVGVHAWRWVHAWGGAHMGCALTGGARMEGVHARRGGARMRGCMHEGGAHMRGCTHGGCARRGGAHMKESMHRTVHAWDDEVHKWWGARMDGVHTWRVHTWGGARMEGVHA